MNAGLRWTGVLLATTALVACGGKPEGKGAGGPGGGRGGPATVGFIVVQPGGVPITTELTGRTVAYQSSEVRPQVSGVIEKRLFTEGQLVRRGQPLYQIDSSLYRASANQAQADLESARANQEAAQAQADRYKPLAAIEAVSKQDYVNAVAAARQAGAAVAQRQAALDTARINLRFTTVPAPIDGRIGRSLFTVGALVTSSQADPLATIQQLDPIYVDIQQSSGDLLAMRRALAAGGATPTRAQVRLTLDKMRRARLRRFRTVAEAAVKPLNDMRYYALRKGIRDILLPEPESFTSLAQIRDFLKLRDVFVEAHHRRARRIARLMDDCGVSRRPWDTGYVMTVNPSAL